MFWGHVNDSRSVTSASPDKPVIETKIPNVRCKVNMSVIFPLSAASSCSLRCSLRRCVWLADLGRSAGPMESSRPRRMVAIFDYDPRESSPNADIEVTWLLGHIQLLILVNRMSLMHCLSRLNWPSARGTSSMCSGTWTLTASTMWVSFVSVCLLVYSGVLCKDTFVAVLPLKLFPRWIIQVIAL